MKKNEDGQGKFPDLSGDGDVTMKDILIGRGVVKKVIKGLKKASKLHASQAKTLKSMVNGKKKRS